MARRRLTDVPCAEHFAQNPLPPGGLETKAFTPGFAPPIARVAAEAAGAAAFEELAETLRRAREEGRLVLDLPLGSIAPDHLTRDRLPAEDEAMASLRESLRAHGQRTPIEVTPLSGALPYGLISGWRRLAALKALHAETGDPGFATVQALVRRPETAAEAYVAMVEENEIRVGLSQYERARVALLAAERGVFASEKAALLTLFASASRAKRSRIRAFLDIVRELDGTLVFPTHLPERLGLQLVERLRTGEGPRIRRALEAAAPASPEAEMALLARLLAGPKAPAPRPEPVTLRDGLTLETRLKGQSLTLTLRGEGVTPELAARIRALLGGL
jgi:ParB family chromosome partitioning protein